MSHSFFPFGEDVARHEDGQTIQQQGHKAGVIVFANDSDGLVYFYLKSLLVDLLQLLLRDL